MKADWIVHLYIVTAVLALSLFVCTYLMGTYIYKAAEELEEFNNNKYVRAESYPK